MPSKSDIDYDGPSILNDIPQKYNRPPSYNNEEYKTSQKKDFDFDFYLPSAPNNLDSKLSNAQNDNTNNDQSASIDFDELTKRFQNLKKE